MIERNGINKKAQIAMWVIITVAIVAVIGVFFLLTGGIIKIQPKEFNFQIAMEDCVKKSVNNVVDKMLPQGGFVNPLSYKVFSDTNVSVLCDTNTFYRSCVNQHPMYLDELKNEIVNYTTPDIKQCFDNVKAEAEKNNYNVDMGELAVEASFAPGRIYMLLSREIKITKQGQTSHINNVSLEILNPLYELANVAMVITNEEAKRCYFEYVGYMLLNPDLDISKFVMSDSTKVYTIKDKKTNKFMNMAVRSCLIRAGI